MHRTLSINKIASAVHASWLKSGDRSYSPFNMQWPALTPEHRKQISRQVRMTLEHVREVAPDIKFVDEYEQPGPGDARWADPESA